MGLSTGSCSEVTENVRIRWTSRADESLDELIEYIDAQPFGNGVARAFEIRLSTKRLIDNPKLAPVRHVRNNKSFRRMVVNRRFYVYYIYYPSRSPGHSGIISIRAVKHASAKNPFSGVRENPRVVYGTQAIH